ncbi:AMP-binding protein [Fibrivirga algicola]|uniref:AMP-binding protein n=1 Tax=Fibrivirga algicola TaxID=2950420 RepID=A0ABX0QNX7_9BACT|nr:AMP-binding protein [Fibrivirga algicola]NID12572.1 AMP-binding protein [Fibrivirga algicola]
MIWTTDNVGRIILDTASRITQLPHLRFPEKELAAVDLQYDLGLNSLQRMELAAYMNELFGIFQTSANNYLLAHTSLSHWINCILRAREQADEVLTFRTSGTTGAAKAVTHSLTTLLTEAQFLTELLPTPRQLITTVPANHIYGFIFTILIPSLWGCPIRLLTHITAADLTEDTLLIGTPLTWELLYRSLPAPPAIRCQGVSSAAPMSPNLFNQLNEAGVRLTEIYGSSDTGGIAYRHAPDRPFMLFPYLKRFPGPPATITNTNTAATYPAPDRLEWISERELQVLGRIDETVPIAGVNVSIAHIRTVIEECPLVAECDVHAKADSGVSQLYAAIRLRTLTEGNRLACLHWINERLTAPEVPKHMYLY